MRINADEIASVIQMEIEKYESQLDVREVGTVLEVGDGIARVYGLSGVMNGEMVEFEGGVTGYAFSLEENSVVVVVRGYYQKLEKGKKPRALATPLPPPGGKPALARLLDPLGTPPDEKAPAPPPNPPRVNFRPPGTAAPHPAREP